MIFLYKRPNDKQRNEHSGIKNGLKFREEHACKELDGDMQIDERMVETS